MARYFRFYEKKRGGRRTGSGKLGTVGEGLSYLSLLVIGFASLLIIFLTMVYPDWQANWNYVEHSCLVIDRRVEKDTDRDTVYRAVQIEYSIGGKTYRPWTFDAAGVYADSRRRAEADIEPFGIGQRVACWYDARNPGTAVVVRHSSALGWLMLLVPVAFVVSGGAGLFYHIFHWGKSAERRSVMGKRLTELGPFDTGGQLKKSYPGVPADPHVTNSPGTKLAYRLPLDDSPGCKLAGSLAACGLWNGGVVLLLWFSISRHFGGDPSWWLTLLTVPFVIIGVWLGYQLLRQLSIAASLGQTWLEVSDLPLRPGGQYELFVSQAGRLKFRRLRVLLVCEEVARFRQGTDTRTEVRRVAQHELLHRDAVETRSGHPFQQSRRFDVPRAAMHSFKADNNAIEWKLVVAGDIVGWPAFRRAFPVFLYPDSSVTEPS